MERVPVRRRRPGMLVWGLYVIAPMAGLWLLVTRPRLDLMWQHQPAHFWLVLTVAAVNVALAIVINEAARRRSDARLFLVALAFFTAAVFLGLHAAATPGVLLAGRNGGFDFATPVGLTLAGGLAALSSIELSPRRSMAILRWSVWPRLAVLSV